MIVARDQSDCKWQKRLMIFCNRILIREVEPMQILGNTDITNILNHCKYSNNVILYIFTNTSFLCIIAYLKGVNFRQRR